MDKITSNYKNLKKLLEEVGDGFFKQDKFISQYLKKAYGEDFIFTITQNENDYLLEILKYNGKDLARAFSVKFNKDWGKKHTSAMLYNLKWENSRFRSAVKESAESVKEHEKEMLADKAKNITLAFEYISINNPIVVHYTHTDYVLIGAHDNRTGKRYPQDKLNQIAKRFGFTQPKVYQYTFEEIQDVLDSQKDIEGFVLENTYGNLIKFKTEEWFRLKDYYGIFFGPLTNVKVVTIIESYLDDEIDDLIAVEQQHEYYKDLGLLNTVLTHAKYFEDEIQKFYQATKDLTDKELGLNWKDYMPSYALSCVFSIRNGEDWRTIRKGQGAPKLALLVQDKIKLEREIELNG